MGQGEIRVHGLIEIHDVQAEIGNMGRGKKRLPKERCTT
jgi:hypothetical protein